MLEGARSAANKGQQRASSELSPFLLLSSSTSKIRASRDQVLLGCIQWQALDMMTIELPASMKDLH